MPASLLERTPGAPDVALDRAAVCGPRRGRKVRLAILVSHPVQYFAPLFRALASRPELDVTVIYCSLGGALPQLDPEFARPLRWDTPLLDGYRSRVVRSWWPGLTVGPLAYLAPGIVRELGSGRYDAAMIFGWASLTCWLAICRTHLQSIPWLIYGDTNVLYEDEKHGLRGWLRNRLLRALFRRTAAFLVSSSMNRLFYERHHAPGAKFFDVPHPIDVSFFRRGSRTAKVRREEIRSSLGLAPDAVVLLFVGKLVERKRPQDLLAVLEDLRETLPGLAVAFVGDGLLRGALESRIARGRLEHAVVLGFRNQSEMPALYAMADVLLLPSQHDPIGMVAHEAAACGLPVIVSDRTGAWGPRDPVRHGENGYVYRCGDIAALADAVRRLACDPDLRRRMGRRSEELVERFTPARCAGTIAEAATFVCGGREEASA